MSTRSTFGKSVKNYTLLPFVLILEIIMRYDLVNHVFFMSLAIQFDVLIDDAAFKFSVSRK